MSWSNLTSGLRLNSIRNPSRNKIWIGQVTFFLPLLVHFLHARLNHVHKVTIVTIDEVDSFVVLKFVAVVKQGIKTECSQGITEASLNLKNKKTSFRWKSEYMKIIYSVLELRNKDRNS